VEGTVREVKRRVRVVASSYRAIDRSVTKWIVVTTAVTSAMEICLVVIEYLLVRPEFI